MIAHGPRTGRSADFHAHHAPIGALASATAGRFFGKSGPSCELGRAGDGGLLVGYHDPGVALRLLPLFPLSDSDRARYVHDAPTSAGSLRVFDPSEVQREYGWATDCWRAGEVVCEMLTPVEPLPDPAHAALASQRDAFVPATLMRITVRNPTAAAREVVFALNLPDQRWLPAAGGLPGMKSRHGVAFAVDAAEAQLFSAFDIESALQRRWPLQPCFGLGSLAGASVAVAAGETRTLTVAIGFWKPGVVTAGRTMSYWYTRLFSSVEDVLSHALARSAAVHAACIRRDAELADAGLSEERQFIIAHATRGYQASTQLLDDGGRPRWVVNEGEYLMMNTFDLTIDMAFHELRFSPWAVANVLDQFASQYRYVSRVFDPAEPQRLLPGGVSFTHDMGVMNTWSPDGRSSYEVDGLDRICFSHMSCEQLTNWVLAAGLYWAQSRDQGFLVRHQGLLVECQTSLLNRDHPLPARRRGYMQCEDERCRGGGEITTYDSLDHTLGQSRANGYLAGKMWAAHVALAAMFERLEQPAVAVSLAAAALSAQAIAGSADQLTGVMPSLLTDPRSAPIIPAIEALAYPWVMGLRAACRDDGPYGAMIVALRRHLTAVLREGVCLYADSGWKLSASADNSWASKIHLCQFVGETVLGVVPDAATAARADRAHADWQRQGAADHAVSDQFTAGIAKGSLYYPRIVTAVLWLPIGT